LYLEGFSSLVKCRMERPGDYPRVEHLTSASLL
jgi:hypothetical protein